MTTQQILREFESLPREEQAALARAIEARLRGTDANGEASALEKANRIRERRAALARLQGAIKWPGSPPTDEEVRDLITDYLTEKYG